MLSVSDACVGHWWGLRGHLVSVSNTEVHSNVTVISPNEFLAATLARAALGAGAAGAGADHLVAPAMRSGDVH